MKCARASISRNKQSGWRSIRSVLSPRPLPEDSPLWALDNVIITPKVGGMTDVYVEQTTPIVRHNLRAYQEGRLSDLINVVANEAAPNR